MNKRGISMLFIIMLVSALALGACQPQVVVETVEVEKIVEVEKEVEVVKEVEVEKVVEATVVVEVEVEKEAPMVEPVGVSVALILPGTISDGGWNGLAYEGLLKLESEGFDIAFTENIGSVEIASVARGYAEDGFDLVIGNGWQHGTALVELGPEFPDQYFFVVTNGPGEGVPENVLFFDPSYHMVGYMAGALAALGSESQIVGVVGGGDNPIQRSIANSFIQAAEETVPGTTGLAINTGDYNDAAKGREAALNMIGNGADVIWHSADITGLGAITGAIEGGAKVIGTVSDQTAIWYPSFLSSTYWDIGFAVYTAGHEVLDGSFVGGGDWEAPWHEIFYFIAGDGKYNMDLVSEENAAKMDEIVEKMISGEIEVIYDIE